MNLNYVYTRMSVIVKRAYIHLYALHAVDIYEE